MPADDDRDPAPDPWDEIVAESLGEQVEEASFRFDDAAAASDPVVAGPDGGAAGTEPDSAADSAGAMAQDALVEEWLSSEDEEASGDVPPLTVFTPEDSAAGSSDIDIGTGESGIELHGAPEQEEIGAGAASGVDAEEGGFGEDFRADGPGAGDGGGEGFAIAAGAPAVAGADAPATRRRAKPAKRSGGIGQMIGVVLGGLMAIPITLAILIYGLGKDPFGIAKQVPPQVAFLLPAKFRPGFRKPSAADTNAPGASALDALPAAAEPAEPAADAAVDGGDDVPAAEPADQIDVDVAVDAVADGAAAGAPEPAAEPASETVAVDPPGLDALGVAPAPVAPVEPPPLDIAALDEAVAEAAALGEALDSVDDRENRAYKLLRVSWYKALARVAEELVAVEHAALTSGRPLSPAAESLAALHGGIAGRETLAAELAALAPDWLAYAKRGSDGVVLPVTFESARKVGPYWAARVTLAGPDGQPRDLTVISWSEPSAIAGDRVVVTGVALDGAVVWAADVRDAGSAGARAVGF